MLDRCQRLCISQEECLQRIFVMKYYIELAHQARQLSGQLSEPAEHTKGLDGVFASSVPDASRAAAGRTRLTQQAHRFLQRHQCGALDLAQASSLQRPARLTQCTHHKYEVGDKKSRPSPLGSLAAVCHYDYNCQHKPSARNRPRQRHTNDARV